MHNRINRIKNWQEMTRPRTACRKVFFFIAVLFFCLVIPKSHSMGGDQSSSAQTPTITHVIGSVKYIIYHDGVSDVRVERPFELWVNGCESFTRLNSGKGPDSGPFQGFEVFCHKANVAMVNIFDRAKFTSQAKFDKPVLVITNQVKVIAGPIPFGGDSQITPIWFGYASQSYRDSIPADQMPRFYTLSPGEFDLTNNFVKMIPSPDSLREGLIPRRIEFYNNGKVMIPIGGGSSVEKTCRKPYDQGYMDAVFEVNDFFDDIKLPKKFALVFFAGIEGATTNIQLARCAAYEVEAYSVEMTSSAPVSFGEVLRESKASAKINESGTSTQTNILHTQLDSQKNAAIEPPTAWPSPGLMDTLGAVR